MLNLLKDPLTNLLCIFFLNWTLIYPSFNPNFSLTLINVYLIINRRWVQWWTVRIKGEWLKAMARKKNNIKQSFKHLKTQSS